jgi:hypothetical protein
VHASFSTVFAATPDPLDDEEFVAPLAETAVSHLLTDSPG